MLEPTGLNVRLLPQSVRATGFEPATPSTPCNNWALPKTAEITGIFDDFTLSWRVCKVSQLIASISRKTPYRWIERRSQFSGQSRIGRRMMRAVVEGSNQVLNYSSEPDRLRRKLFFWRCCTLVATSLLTFTWAVLLTSDAHLWWLIARDFIGRPFGHPISP
jgi:hypothetical protein